MINIKNIFVLHTFVIILYGSSLPSAYADPVSKNQEKILCFEDRVDQDDNDRIVRTEQAVKFKSYDCQDLSGNVSGKDVQKSDGRTKRIPQYVPDGRNDGKITLTGKEQDKKAADEAGRVRAKMTEGGTVLLHGQDGTRERERIRANTDIRTFDDDGSDRFIITEGGALRLRGQDVNSEEVEQKWAIRPADAKARTACRVAGDKSDAGCRTEVNKGILTRDEAGRVRAKMTEGGAVRLPGQDGNSEVVQKKAIRPADAKAPQSNSKKDSNDKSIVNLVRPQKQGTKKPGCSLHDSVHC